MKTAFVVIPLLVLVSAAASAPEQPAVLKAAKTAFKIEFAARGSFVPAAAVTVVPRPEGWRGRYVVDTVVEPGTIVRKGDVVLSFDRRAIVEALSDARFDMGHAERNHEFALRRLAHGAAAADWGMKRKEREYEHAVRRMSDWVEYEKPRDLARAALDRKGQEQTVKNAEEELKQLEKMYEEDELVDDTEMIVMERSRWNLERRRKYRDWWIQARKWTDETTRPRWEEQQDFDLKLKLASLERAREEFRMGAESREMSRAKAERAWSKKKRNIERLEFVLATMEIKAPADGVLLHGPLEGATGRVFKPGTQVSVEAAVISVVTPGDLVVVLTVPAKEGLRLVVGTTVSIQPDAVGAEKFETRIAHRTLLPKGGNYTVRCEVPAGVPAGLLGTAVAAKIVLEETKEVLSVPAAAVFTAGKRSFVLRADGLAAVKTGRESGGRVEILEGLAESDEILPAPAEPKK